MELDNFYYILHSFLTWVMNFEESPNLKLDIELYVTSVHLDRLIFLFHFGIYSMIYLNFLDPVGC